jgi:hypothetical protein
LLPRELHWEANGKRPGRGGVARWHRITRPFPRRPASSRARKSSDASRQHTQSKVLTRTPTPVRPNPPWASINLIGRGDHSPDCHLIVSGLACRYTILACRYTILADRSRLIMAFLVSGELSDAEIFILKDMDHCASALIQTHDGAGAG